MTELNLDEIKQRVELLPGGDWFHSIPDDMDPDFMSEESWPVFEGLPFRAFVAMGADANVAAFIAHARTDVPALIAEVQRLSAQVERLRDAVRWYAEWVEQTKPAPFGNTL